MRTTIFAISFIVLAFSGKAQIFLSHVHFTGDASDQLKTKWGVEIPLSLPVPLIYFGGKDSAKADFALAPGVRWTWANFEKNLIVKREDQQTFFIEDPDPDHHYRSQFYRSSSFLQTTTLSLAMLLTYYPERPYSAIVGGVYADYLIGGKFKRTYTEDGDRMRTKDKLKDEGDFYGMERLRYGIVICAAFKRVTLYGRYSLTPLFEPDQGLDIKEFSLGIGILFVKLKNMQGSTEE